MRVSLDECILWSDAITLSGMDLEMRDGMIEVQDVVPGGSDLSPRGIRSIGGEG